MPVVPVPAWLLIPRIATSLRSLSNWTPGIKRVISAKLLTPRFSSCAPLKAETLTGTLLKGSACRVAVTMMSALPVVAEAAAGGFSAAVCPAEPVVWAISGSGPTASISAISKRPARTIHQPLDV